MDPTLALTTLLVLPPQAPPDLATAEPVAERLQRIARETAIVVAHRGASAAFPENTLPAFRAGVEAGAPVVELDFHQSRDGELVVIHDETLDRTTDSEQVLGRKELPVAEVTLAELRRLDAGSWRAEAHAGAGVPTLREALAVILPRAIPMIEHKSGEASRLVEILRRVDAVDSVLVQSFDWDWLEEVHALEPRLALAALGKGELGPAHLERLPRTGATMLHWAGGDLRWEDVLRLHRDGYLVGAFTLNADLTLLGAVALGVDAITTDRPARLLHLLEEGAALRPPR